MTIDDFIVTNKLLPADAVMVQKEPIKLLDHCIVYLGIYGGRHTFIGNFIIGTRILSGYEIASFAEGISPERIIRFKGNGFQRNTAVQRALSRRDQTSYHLILNNCLHNSSHALVAISNNQQTKTVGTGLVISGLITAASTQKAEIQTAGLFAAALGLITLLLDDN